MKVLTKKKIITAVAVLATFFAGSNYYYETKLKTKDIYLETEYPSINVGDEIELNYIVPIFRVSHHNFLEVAF